MEPPKNEPKVEEPKKEELLRRGSKYGTAKVEPPVPNKSLKGEGNPFEKLIAERKSEAAANEELKQRRSFKG